MSTTLRDIIENIYERATEHPACDFDLLESQDIRAICDVGGDICDWTMVAIDALAALDLLDKFEEKI